jgi:leader peptidase (prepilin peptidase)/N-methyltransferase
VEALTAGVFVFLIWWYGTSWELLPALYFSATMILVTVIDFDARIIPDAITLPGVGLGILASLLTPVSLVDSVLGAAAGFLLLLGIGWGYKRLTGADGMGGGDIKFAALLGAFLGWQGFLLTVFLASLAGTVVGLILMITGRGGRRTALPFGSFLAPAAWITYVWGGDVVGWYIGLMRP